VSDNIKYKLKIPGACERTQTRLSADKLFGKDVVSALDSYSHGG